MKVRQSRLIFSFHKMCIKAQLFSLGVVSLIIKLPTHILSIEAYFEI